MKGLKELLSKEQIRLEQIIDETKARLSEAPEGTLRLSKSHGYPQYYQCTDEKKAGSYIAKENTELVRKLAQKSYDEKKLRQAEKRLSQIKKLTKDYEDDELENIYFREHEERQRLIQPVEPTWEQKLRDWKSKEYKGKDFQDGVAVILTEKGERVRSKSEKIMADYFFRNGIEYKYECPLYLKGIGLIYPDFTFFSRETGKEIYWEHNGKVDDPAYARKMVQKIQAYENNGIYPGERLILTFETEQTILNTGKIKQIIRKYLI